MRGMAAEFRGHVDEMVRQSELDDVKKQLESTPGLDLQSLDPTREIKNAIQEGMAEGEKAVAEGKSAFDNLLAEPESAPQVAAEASAAEQPSIGGEALPEPAPVPEPASVIASEPLPEPAPATAAEAPSIAEDEKPAKAVAAG